MMAASTTNRSILAISLLSLAFAASASSVFDKVLGNVKPCEQVCENTFPSHTYEEGTHHGSCRRGCRFFSIMEFVHNHDQINETRKDCEACCKEAYKKEADVSACALGCRSQAPFSAKREEKEKEDDPNIHLLYPLMYVHSLYSNMIDKAYRHMSVSWSFYMQADNGKLVIVKSQPQFYAEFMDEQDVDDYKALSTDDKTTNYWETNIEPIDNAATPILKNSQLRSARSFGDGINFSASDNNSLSADWLSCIAKKTGIPRLFLCLLILFCAVVMIWLCLTAAVTAPDQKVSQKLSINGDLEYLREMVKQGKGIQILHPQDRIEASPLPIKIRVERI